MPKTETNMPDPQTTPPEFETEYDRLKAQKDAIIAKQRGRLGDLLGLARIKCTRRFQGEDYPGLGGEVRLGIDATSHLREVLALIEEAQNYV